MPFIPNPLAAAHLAAELHKSGEMRRMAEQAAEKAKALAPVDEGDYRDSIEVVDTDTGVAVVAKDWKAALIEFGTSKLPAHAPLRRGVRAAGFQLRETRKKK